MIKAIDLSEENKSLLECENVKGIEFFSVTDEQTMI